ncbi:MAG TPA: ABC-F family ATP-binding cassette domain-containing protein [Acidobacteriaceae bacterium]|nr:ABC-F family ATP-binding cassette domain-containing protein [Acidobacteriaceae bacterium]
MPPILNAQGLSIRFGAQPLFRNVSFTVSQGDRIGLIGPNGSGKSTLIGILAGRIDADEGEVALRKLARVSFVAQESEFAAGMSVRDVLTSALRKIRAPESEWEARIAETLGRTGFEDFDQSAAKLSGGWQKRLAIAEAMVELPDVLLLDEPTNHLDLAGIQWLEDLLNQAAFACVFVSHDRYFLENVALEMVELDRIYPDGVLRVRGKYDEFLEKKEAFLLAQSKHQDALTNRVHTEMEWLRRGPKARATKAKARIQTANAMIGELAEMKSRTRTAKAGIEFSASERQTKRLVELENVTYAVNGRTLFQNLNFILTAGMRVGLVGANGSGKTTLLRLLTGETMPIAGSIKKTDALRIVYLDQTRELDERLTLRRALAPDSDSVVYQGRVVHVASWAAKFLFTGEQLNQPVERLSGGERARVLIARLMLQPADVLLLDEPTNDLDIPTLEILEESLLEYPGALVLVTHDRYMLDRVSTVVLGLDGQGGAERFADYSQWDTWQAQNQYAVMANTTSPLMPETQSANVSGGTVKKVKLSYLEAREFSGIEDRVVAAEGVLDTARAALEDSAIVSDGPRLLAVHAQLEKAQDAVDQLYARWAELIEKQK